MKRYTREELFAFVGRADTKEKVIKAEQFIRKLDYIDNGLFDDLTRSLTFIYRELNYREEEKYMKPYPV